MIKAFDNQNLKQIRSDIDAAFAALRQKHGVTLSIGTISYDREGVKATARLTMIAVGDPGVNTNDPRQVYLAKAQAEFKRSATLFGLKPEQYGSIFKQGRESYKLVGLKPRAGVYPVLGQRLSDGKTYKFPESVIASLQTKEYKDIHNFLSPKTSAPTDGTCSNDNAFDAQYRPIGKCSRPATTTRKEGIGRHGKQMPFCAECAQLIDESRAEVEAEARANR